MKNLAISLVFLISIIWSGNSFSQETPQQIILKSANTVLDTMQEFRKNGVTDTKFMGKRLLEIIQPVTDFKSISKAVMGKYYKLASQNQKDKFTPIFKQTMAQLYAKSLIKFEIDSISINKEASHVLDKKSKIVTTVVASDGSIYSIIYSMRKNNNDKWLVRNIILDGINLGLTYRNQFYSSANQYDGDIDKVIDNWSQEMDVK